ncbi:MAG: nicotinate (nicotinamide) nucleotide adenylyltransferase [Christensenellaceae bacterium]|jgi:nicotinate-nucleotide adenylyltransferase|nr:nicotinate (nicotinamide) nucleotide adenylyltransferase [Christensenellaceae bacterium]
MKFGLFGGAFDPLHNEHVDIIQLARKAANLDALIIVPSHNPPHKDKDLAPFKNRIEMLRLFAKDKPYIIIDSIENSLSKADSYAYEIIPELINKYGGDLVYIIGGDSLVDFDTWKRPDLILKQIPLLVFSRLSYNELELKARDCLLAKHGGTIEVLGYGGNGISSSTIKAQIETGFIKDAMIPESIKDYILQNNLYNTFNYYVNKLKTNISQERFEHSARTAIYATSFCTKLGLNYKDVFLASLLHDCAKEIEPLSPITSYNVPYKVIHQFDGKIIAEDVYGIKNPDILDAIEYHTTGKPRMSTIGKLIYASDKLEPDRYFVGIEEIRKLIVKDFDKGFLKLLKKTTEFLLDKKITLDPSTKDAYDYYLK